jgi:hypothetical protein
MTIKYADITIIRNFKDENILKTFCRFIGYDIDDDIIGEDETIIVKFDDGMICDIKDEYSNKKYKFSEKAIINMLFPIHFTFSNITLFYRTPVEDKDGLYHQDFRCMFNSYTKDDIIASPFNVIYQDANRKEKFSIVRIQSTEEKPRFKLAYEDALFDKSDIIYLIDCIFKDKFNYKI